MKYPDDHHVLPLFGPIKNTRMQGPFFLSLTSKLYQQKLLTINSPLPRSYQAALQLLKTHLENEMLFQKVQQK